MELMDILKTENTFRTVIVYNKSPQYFSLMLNLFKRKYNISNDSAFLLNSLSEVSNYSDIIRVSPLESDCWLFYIEDTSNSLTKEQVALIANAPSVLLVVGTSNYGAYLNWKSSDRFRKLDMTFIPATRLSTGEFDWVYGTVLKVPDAERLREDLKVFVRKRYLKEPESVFTLLSALKSGYPFGTETEIVNFIGVGSISMERVMLGILETKYATERGLNMFITKRGSELVELSRRNGCEKLYRDFLGLVKGMLDVKILILSGKLVVGLQNQLVAPFDKGYPRRWMYYLENIEKIPMNRIVLLLDVLSGEKVWKDELQVMGFLQKYIYTVEKAKKEANK